MRKLIKLIFFSLLLNGTTPIIPVSIALTTTTCIVSVKAESQTTVYLYRTITLPYSPTVNAGWNTTSGNTYVLMMPNKNYGILVASGTITSGASGGAGPKKMLSQTWMTQPLQAQTLASASTISIQIRMNANGTSGVTTHTGFIYARVMNEDGTIAAEIGNVASGGGVLSTTATNRTFSLTLGSNVSIPNNGRIVIEIGGSYTGNQSILTSTITSVMSGTVSDLPVDNTTTTALVPWVQFSQTLLFAKGVTL
jgi:hypothetical protein